MTKTESREVRIRQFLSDVDSITEGLPLDRLSKTNELVSQLERDLNELPSAHTIDDQVWLCLWSHKIHSEIHAVHFTAGKVKYDLNVFGEGGGMTRLYNVDSAFVAKTIPE